MKRSAKTSIAEGGYFEGRRVGLEASVKDSRQKDGWACYGFENGALKSAKAFPDARCHSCHEAHGEVDSVFVQFYPNLRDTAELKFGPYVRPARSRALHSS